MTLSTNPDSSACDHDAVVEANAAMLREADPGHYDQVHGAHHFAHKTSHGVSAVTHGRHQPTPGFNAQW